MNACFGCRLCETSVELDERQLRRIRVYVFEHDADDEMLEALDSAIEANDFWIDPKIAEDLRMGNLRSGQA
jgi:hypothetical protein